MRSSIGALLNLVFESKKQGKGRLGRGKVYTKLIEILFGAECLNTANIFGGSIDRFLLRIIRNETEYPYSIFNIHEADVFITDEKRVKSALLKMKDFCSEVLDEEKTEALVYSLLEMLRQDTTINTLIYGCKTISKTDLFGSTIYPTRICIEALLLSLLYHVHKYPTPSKEAAICHLAAPESIEFKIVHFSDYSSLDLQYEIDIIDFIKNHTYEKGSNSANYELDINVNNITLSQLPDSGNLFVYGENSETTFNCLNTNSCTPLYLKLSAYDVNDESIIDMLLLKYRYLNEYSDHHKCCIIEGEEAVIKEAYKFEALFKAAPINSQKQFVLWIDGLSERILKKHPSILSSIKRAVENWKNVRIIISGREVPDMAVFSSFIKAEIAGVNTTDIRNRISDYDSFDPSLKTLLRDPILLNRYLDPSNKRKTYGELLDYYYSEYLIEQYAEYPTIIFLIKHILPFIGRRISDFKSNCIKRSDASDVIEKALHILIDNEIVYQNYIAANTVFSVDRTNINSLIETILDTEIMSESITGELVFTSHGGHSYFVAKYFINTIEMLDIAFEKENIYEKQELFRCLDLGSVWFENKSIYRLVGEITGDYRNTSESAHYYKSQLDVLLEMCREFDCFRATENIIYAMASVRANTICDVDFSNTSLPLTIQSYISFSDVSGELPCDFSKCHVFYISLLEPLLFSVSSGDERLILAAFEDSYAVLWDCNNRKVLWTSDLHSYLKNDSGPCYAEFNANSISVYGSISGIELDLSDGTVRNRFDISEHRSNNYDKWLENGCISQNASYMNLQEDILRQLSHFKNCDFSDAVFEFDKYKELLKKMGAII